MLKTNSGDSLRRETNWYVVTGGPSSGKTTTINILKQRGYKTTIEHARHYLDMQVLIGRSVDEVRSHLQEFQLAVLELQIEEEKKLVPDAVVFLDRGIPDVHAYYHFLNIPETIELTQALQNISYKKIFMLDCLPLVKDYARREDEVEQKKIQDSLIEVYESLPFPVLRVPVLEPEARADFIVSNL